MKVSNEIIAGKLIMQIQIFIDNSRISSLEGRYGKVTMIPFTGHVKSEIFTGEIVPGGVDVQIENAAGNRNMCAKYMFRGTDKEGKEKDILTYGILDVAKNKYLYYTAGIDVAKRLERDWNFYDDNNPDNTAKQLICTSHLKEE